MNPISKRIFIGCFCFFLSIQYAVSQTLYAVLVADITDGGIGAACANDIEVMSENLRQISQSIDYELKAIVLTNANFRATTIRATLANLQPQPQDILFYYYSGHGYNVANNPSLFPFFNVADYQLNPISVDEVANTLKAKNARLCITLGDCCNKVAEATRSVGKRTRTKASNSSEEAQQIIKKLFLMPTGTIKIASSKVGQFSWSFGSDGSAYTMAFEEAFEDCLLNTKDIEWEQLLNDTQQRLQQRPLKTPQNSIFEVLLNTPSPAPSPVVAPPAVVAPPSISYADLNSFLGMIANETKPATERQAAQAKLNDYFVANAHIKLFVNDTEVESQSIEQFLGRLYLNAAKIREVNVIQKASLYNPIHQRYSAVAVQEIWEK